MVPPLEQVTSGERDGTTARAPRDARSIRILAKTIYRELRQSGLEDQDVMSLAGELLSLLTSDVKDRRIREVAAGPEPSSRR